MRLRKKRPEVAVSIGNVQVTRRPKRDLYIPEIGMKDNVIVTGNAEFDAWLVLSVDTDELVEFLSSEIRRAIREVVDRVKAESVNWEQT
jgi:hypothetical protein